MSYVIYIRIGEPSGPGLPEAGFPPNLDDVKDLRIRLMRTLPALRPIRELRIWISEGLTQAYSFL